MNLYLQIQTEFGLRFLRSRKLLAADRRVSRLWSIRGFRAMPGRFAIATVAGSIWAGATVGCMNLLV